VALRFGLSQRESDWKCRLSVGASIAVSAVWFDLSSCAHVKVVFKKNKKSALENFFSAKSKAYEKTATNRFECLIIYVNSVRLRPTGVKSRLFYARVIPKISEHRLPSVNLSQRHHACIIML
jgi:hypothetical protein